jgi:HEAT repeat protein
VPLFWLFGPPNIEKMRARRDVKGLIKALGYKKDTDVREAAAEALDELGWQPDKSEIGAAYWVVRRQWGKCVEIGAPAVEPLLAALKDARNVARWAAGALAEIGAPAILPLRAALSDAENVARWVAGALVEIGAPAVEPLIAALKDADKEVRGTAAEALGKIGDARAVGPLSAALRDADEDVRKAAAEALEKLGQKPDNA